MMVGGSVVSAIGLGLSIIFLSLGWTHPIFFFGMIFFVGAGNGMTLPSANAGVVGVRPKLAGSASGLSGSIQLGGGALLSVLGGYSLTGSETAIPLLVVMFCTTFAGILSSLYVIYVEFSLKQETDL